MIMFVSVAIFSQEALKSTEEEYYDFLSLTGVVERPTLGYRTLSDSVWTYNDVESFEENEDGTFTKVLVSGKESDQNIWKNNNLGTTYTLWSAEDPADNWFVRGIKQSLTMRIYGPEWFNSYNTTVPYGQNDGALWQGRGYNTALTGGIRFEGYGFEATFKPQVSFSQNLEFELMASNYDSPFGYFRGYSTNVGIDAPQRFGDSAFWNFDWGDSEIRWMWKTVTLGFGTQSIYLGPTNYNSILHTNNAPTYPKFDIGIRKTKVTIPYFNWYIGDIESRIWMGYLTESDYFDSNNTNNHNRINGFTFSYSTSFLSGLSFGVTKVCVSKWDSFDINYLNPFYSANGGVGTAVGEDQKASLFVDYVFNKIGLEIYGEIGIDDYLQGGFIYGSLRYPFDSMLGTIGLKKSYDLTSTMKIECIIELSNMEQPRNRLAANTSYTYNFHHQITQGYTNKGQYIGTFLANGGNSQIFALRLYYSKGLTELYLQRYNPDSTFSFVNQAGNHTYKANSIVSLFSNYYLNSYITVFSGITFDYIINSYYYFESEGVKKPSINQSNFSFELGVKYLQ